jgi:hypothetical protein
MFDFDKSKARLAELNAEVECPNLWTTPRAQRLMHERTALHHDRTRRDREGTSDRAVPLRLGRGASLSDPEYLRCGALAPNPM